MFVHYITASWYFIMVICSHAVSSTRVQGLEGLDHCLPQPGVPSFQQMFFKLNWDIFKYV